MKSCCFNCGGGHRLNECQEQRDFQRINENRKKFMDKAGGMAKQGSLTKGRSVGGPVQLGVHISLMAKQGSLTKGRSVGGPVQLGVHYSLMTKQGSLTKGRSVGGPVQLGVHYSLMTKQGSLTKGRSVG